MNYEEENIQSLQQSVEVLSKIVDKVLFKDVEVKYDFHVATKSIRPYVLLQFYLDIDKQFKGSPTYDENYQKAVHEIEHKVNDLLRYAGLSPIGPNVLQHYSYINDEYVQEVVKNCHDEIINILTNEYKIPYHLIQEYSILVQLQENPDYPGDTNIMAYSHSLGKSGLGTDSGFMDRGVDCDKLIEIADNVFDLFGVRDSGFPYHNFMCERDLR
ncbi:hypothetical protein EB155_06415 [archaeon]|nr:hypothetical protein [archaeon]NDB79482.1 hypothetical protein [archaeon]